MTSIRLIYFSWVRETLGLDSEIRQLPDHVQDVGDCVGWLTNEGENYKAAFADLSRLRFALDQQMAGLQSPISGALELAIFPPVTGG